jgi:aminobutyraldehyde dehydrogenase
MLLALADAIDANSETLAELESLNCGKPYLAALNDEMPAVADVFRFFAGAIRTMTGSLAGEYISGHTSIIRRDPLGVVASIAPWNYPLMMAAWKLGPALAAGTLKLAQLISEIFPAGVVNVLNGRGESVGAPMISQPQVRMISITGDISTGQKIMDVAAKSVKRTHLELGGKAPVIVFDDADIASVVEGVRTFGFYNAGQDCTAACRIYAGKKVYEKLVAELSIAAASIKVGTQKEKDVEMGRRVSASAWRVLLIVPKHKNILKSPRVAKRALAMASFMNLPLLRALSKPMKLSAKKCLALWFQSPALMTKSK